MVAETAFRGFGKLFGLVQAGRPFIVVASAASLPQAVFLRAHLSKRKFILPDKLLCAFCQLLVVEESTQFQIQDASGPKISRELED